MELPILKTQKNLRPPIIGFILFHTTIRFFLGLKGVNAVTTSIEYLMGQGMSALEATQKNAAYDTVMGIFT